VTSFPQREDVLIGHEHRGSRPALPAPRLIFKTGLSARANDRRAPFSEKLRSLRTTTIKAKTPTL
jgi:hypothetical protein